VKAPDFEESEELILEGTSLNVVGLPGSGRSSWVARFEQHLTEGGWTCLRWTSGDLKTMDRQEMKSAVHDLSERGLPVLLIDDFGSLLVEENGPWLERLLFSYVNERGEARAPLRVVLVTAPRDREIVAPASVLRERCRVVVPVPCDPTEDDLRALGCGTRVEVEELTGLCTHLGPRSGRNPDEERGILMRRCLELLPCLVGELDGALQRRLGMILRRASPPSWRPEAGDRLLRPLVVCGGNGSTCAVPSLVDREELATLLLSERWPEGDLVRSARRFAARCGNEPAPIWTDNYLSDMEQLDFRRLARFLVEVLRVRPPGTRLRLLSRSHVGGVRASPARLGEALRAELSEEAAARLEWKLYDRAIGGNLHLRELSLPRRGVGFSLPIATMIVGQTPMGNESDAELPLFENRPAQEAWANGVPVVLSEG